MTAALVLPSLTEPGERHCATCACPVIRAHLIVYPPNVILYGTCPVCGQVRWVSELWDYAKAARDPDRAYSGERSAHCGCCTHEHRGPGGYDLLRVPQDPA